MPRKGRIDAPGALHHVMQRGMERGRIFRGDADCARFLGRMKKLFRGTRTSCYAWALMPNHIHLLLSTGDVPLAKVLHRLFCGYAVHFNNRYRRNGHLFQGRYKSILCEREAYFLELVRYIHLNPIRTGVVEGLEQLAGYEWTGHRELIGREKDSWMEGGEVLRHFGRRLGQSRKAYMEFMRDGLGKGEEAKFEGENLRHLVEGGWELVRRKPNGEDEYADERLLGSRDFVSRVLREAGERERWRSRLAGDGLKPPMVLERAAKAAGVVASEVVGSGKRPGQCLARALACKWLVDDLGEREVAVAKLLGITQPAVSTNVMRGRVEERERGFKLAEKVKGRIL